MTTCPRRLKPAFWLAAALTMIVAGLLMARPASAGNDDNPLANVPFELRFDLAKAYQSPVGSTIMKHVRQAKPNADELMDGLVETLGLDPRTAVSTLVLRGQGINEMDLQLIADLGNSTGKLEGWMLGLPGYASEDLDDETLLHSFFLHDHADETKNVRTFGSDGVEEHRIQLDRIRGFIENTKVQLESASETQAIEDLRNEIVELEAEYALQELALKSALDAEIQPESALKKSGSRLFVSLPESNGRFTLVASLDSKTTTDLAKTIRADEAILDEAEALQGDQLMRLSVADLTRVNVPRNAPGSAVLESITGLTLTVGSGDNVTANMVMNTASPARARQVTQLLQGLIALTQLAALEQPEMQQLANLLGDVKIATLNDAETSGGPGVTANFSGSHAEFEKWVDWFAQQAK